MFAESSRFFSVFFERMISTHGDTHTHMLANSEREDTSHIHTQINVCLQHTEQLEPNNEERRRKIREQYPNVYLNILKSFTSSIQLNIRLILFSLSLVRCVFAFASFVLPCNRACEVQYTICRTWDSFEYRMPSSHFFVVVVAAL